MKQTIAYLKSIFVTGAKPTQQHFSELIDSFRHKDDTVTFDDVKNSSNVSLTTRLSEINENKQEKTKLLTLSENNEYMTFADGVATISNIPSGVVIFDFGANVVRSLVITACTQTKEVDIAQIVFVADSSVSFNIPASLEWYDNQNNRTSSRVELTIQNFSIR